MSVESVTIKAEGLTVSRVIWQFLKRQPKGYLEQVLAFNPGLADLGNILPVGTIINFPLDNIPAERAERAVIRLWD